MTGTQDFEGIAGTKATIDDLIDLGRSVGGSADSSRAALTAAYTVIANYERELVAALRDGLSSIRSLKVLGITDRSRLHERAPTVNFVHNGLTPVEIADRLGEQGLFVGHGNFYALQSTETLRLEPDGCRASRPDALQHACRNRPDATGALRSVTIPEVWHALSLRRAWKRREFTGNAHALRGLRACHPTAA